MKIKTRQELEAKRAEYAASLKTQNFKRTRHQMFSGIGKRTA